MCARPYLAALGALLAIAPARLPADAPAPTGARIVGAISLRVRADNLKHWGVPGAQAGFVPDDDRSAYARAIRAATGARELCRALESASGRDALVSAASTRGDGNLNHPSGDEVQLHFVINVARRAPITHGTLYVCSEPLFAILSRGAYPDERFYQAGAEHRVRLSRRALTLVHGAVVEVRLAASIDATGW